MIELWAELYPASVEGQRMLAESYIDRGDSTAAMEPYTRLSQQHPDDRRIQSHLEWLRNR